MIKVLLFYITGFLKQEKSLYFTNIQESKTTKISYFSISAVYANVRMDDSMGLCIRDTTVTITDERVRNLREKLIVRYHSSSLS